MQIISSTFEYKKLKDEQILNSLAVNSHNTLDIKYIISDEILSSGFERIPQVTKSLNEEQVADVEKLLEMIEDDDDVQNVYHTMQE